MYNKEIVMYYKVKNMNTPTPEMYGVGKNQKVLLIGTARPQPWAVSVDIDPAAPADVVANGLQLPFADKHFDVVILDYVTNFLPKESMVSALITEANRVGKKVKGRCTVTPGRRQTLRGPKQRFTHRALPPGCEWLTDERLSPPPMSAGNQIRRMK